MSGPTGYYRYPCIWHPKVHCRGWVYQKDDACGGCIAAGRRSGRDLLSCDLPTLYNPSISSAGFSEYRYAAVDCGCLKWVSRGGEHCEHCLATRGPTTTAVSYGPLSSAGIAVPFVDHGSLRYAAFSWDDYKKYFRQRAGIKGRTQSNSALESRRLSLSSAQEAFVDYLGFYL
ncbi:hypothetical protein LTR66_002663 [Elasticomyces elasticus]|nr:hypothetical protein LTR66_002663 [Elasticomyces elasticus]